MTVRGYIKRLQDFRDYIKCLQTVRGYVKCLQDRAFLHQVSTTPSLNIGTFLVISTIHLFPLSIFSVVIIVIRDQSCFSPIFSPTALICATKYFINYCQSTFLSQSFRMKIRFWFVAVECNSIIRRYEF